MSVTTKTLGTVGIALLFILLYLSPFLLGFYELFYVALVMSFVMLAIIARLGSGRD